MFERYTEPARRAIFFARAEAVLRGSPAITPAHLLLGLSWEETSWANRIALLKDRLPDLCAQMEAPFRPCTSNQLEVKCELGLDRDSKIALAYTAQEADRNWDYEIGTHHLLCGLLRFSNVASSALNVCGIDLAGVRATSDRYRENLPLTKRAWVRKIRWGALLALRTVPVRLLLMAIICTIALLVLRHFNL